MSIESIIEVLMENTYVEKNLGFSLEAFDDLLSLSSKCEMHNKLSNELINWYEISDNNMVNPIEVWY